MTEKTTSIDDLKRRAKQLDDAGEAAYNIYEKLLAWRMLAYEAIERLEGLGEPAGIGIQLASPPESIIEDNILDCEGVELGGRGKLIITKYQRNEPSIDVDIRMFAVRKT